MNRLTKIFEACDISTMDDLLSCMMATIEDGLLQSGFVPNEDYTKKDLLNAALPMVHSSYHSNDLSITTGWHNHNQ